MFSVVPFTNNYFDHKAAHCQYLDTFGGAVLGLCRLSFSPDHISLQLTSYSFALAHAAAPKSLLRGYTLYHRPFNLFGELAVVNCMSSRIALHVLT